MLPALADIARDTPQGVVPIVVAHAGVLRAVRRHAGAVDEHLANLGGLWFAVDPDGRDIHFVGLFEPSHRTSPRRRSAPVRRPHPTRPVAFGPRGNREA